MTTPEAPTREAAMSGEAGLPWQTMETAPRDGTEVLVFVPGLFSNGLITIARWSTDRYSKRPIARWDSRDTLYSRSDAKLFPPSHWAPLSVPSRAALAAAEGRG